MGFLVVDKRAKCSCLTPLKNMMAFGKRISPKGSVSRANILVGPDHPIAKQHQFEIQLKVLFNDANLLGKK